MKKMKLSVKMGLGFGALVLISAVLGGIGWNTVRGIDRNMTLQYDMQACTALTQEMRRQEKNFILRGFAPLEGDQKNSVEAWKELKTTLNAKLDACKNSPSMTAAQKEPLRLAESGKDNYCAAFEALVEARQKRETNYAAWGAAGKDLVAQIENAVAKSIQPAWDEAKKNTQTYNPEAWNQINLEWYQLIMAKFLLLRVDAVYFIATHENARWDQVQTRSREFDAALNDWSKQIQGQKSIETAVQEIQSALIRYMEFGQVFYSCLLEEKKCDAEMVQSAREFAKHMETLQTSVREGMTDLMNASNLLSLALAAAGVILGILLAFFITRGIVKPLSRIIAGLSEGAEQVASAAGQVSSASQSLAEGATEQAAGLEETSSSLEEMASMTKKNAENSQNANTLAEEARDCADKGNEAMKQMTHAISDIQKSADETSKIIKVIDEIAFQTNLLALNAAVEAARAGEAGKGFAVVAEEVRNLAQRSADAAKNTASMIEESVKNAQNGVGIADSVAKLLGDITATNQKVNHLVNEISAATREQSQGIDQVNTAVAQMDKVTQQNAANAEESASASEELSAQAQQMHSMVAELTLLVTRSETLAASTSRPDK